MRALYNLVVDLDERFAACARETGPPAASLADVEFCASTDADETVLAWIDDEFGGSWSSQAYVGRNALARRGTLPVGFATYDPQNLRFRWLRGVARERGVGVFGPLGVAESERGKGIGRRLLRAALGGLHERGYSRALIAAVGEERVPYYVEAAGARIAECFDRAALLAPAPRVVVMASGNGSNLQAVLDAARAGVLPIEIAGVVVNDSRAYAIERARAARLTAASVVWSRKEETRAAYDARLLAAVTALQPDIVMLLGWMHLLAEPFVAAFPELLNLHPAFLPLDPLQNDVGMPDGTRIPAFRGAFAIRDALAAGTRWVGASVHAVTPDADRGAVVVRKPLRVGSAEGEAEVMARLHPLEHRLVVAAVIQRLYERT
ncbi:MAG TPA: GNAT family N-acetyltransferase [Candidatus Tumulicola sp.]|jgi:phosphoribosylglycinamide formyltransferase-1